MKRPQTTLDLPADMGGSDGGSHTDGGGERGGARLGSQWPRGQGDPDASSERHAFS